jgi:hypothetical protein
MKKILFTTALFFIVLSACISNKPNYDIQSTAMAFVETSIVQTETAKPTITPTLTTIATFVLPTPSPLPTQPSIFISTPNAIQVERWKEYEIALAKSLLPEAPISLVFCEWIILGQSDLKQEVYVVAVCGTTWSRSSVPAVIYLNSDSSIQKIQKVDYGSTRDLNIQALFPKEIQDIIYSDAIKNASIKLKEHLSFRLANSGYPPLIVISITPIP